MGTIGTIGIAFAPAAHRAAARTVGCRWFRARRCAWRRGAICASVCLRFLWRPAFAQGVRRDTGQPCPEPCRPKLRVIASLSSAVTTGVVLGFEPKKFQVALGLAAYQAAGPDNNPGNPEIGPELPHDLGRYYSITDVMYKRYPVGTPNQAYVAPPEQSVVTAAE